MPSSHFSGSGLAVVGSFQRVSLKASSPQPTTSDPQYFSGTVIVEWNNVPGGIDASPDWALLHRP
jgi:hypothetical protein